MITKPFVEHREEQPYVAIRKTVEMNEIPTLLPPLIPKVFSWLDHKNVKPEGPPFFRYLQIDKDNKLVVEVGVPVSSPIKDYGGSEKEGEQVIAGSFPPGRYVKWEFFGHYKDLPFAHTFLEDWLYVNKLQEDASADGKKWGNRTEFYVTDPEKVPNYVKWQTDVLFLLKD